MELWLSHFVRPTDGPAPYLPLFIPPLRVKTALRQAPSSPTNYEVCQSLTLVPWRARGVCGPAW